MTQNTGEIKASSDEVLRMTAEVVSAYVGNNTLPAAEIPEVINTVYASLSRIDGTKTNEGKPPKAPGPDPQVHHTGLHRLPRGRQETQNAEAAPPHRVRHDT